MFFVYWDMDYDDVLRNKMRTSLIIFNNVVF